MSTLARQVLGASRKRKDREGPHGFKPPPPQSKIRAETIKPSPLGRIEQQALPAKNRLLAGYLAHEFLTKGTLFGQQLEPPARSEPSGPQPGSYADVAYLLRVDGTHVSGVVNPKQLGRWIQKASLSS